MTDQALKIYEDCFPSRFFLGTARYPSPEILQQAVTRSKASLITVSLRRELIGRAAEHSSPASGFQTLLKALNLPVLPNTAGCMSLSETITTAQMGREIFGTKRVKLEVTLDEESLQPNVLLLVEAARRLCQEGFHVYPYTTPDLSIAEQLLRAGCRVLMPGAAPIGTGQGINDPNAMKRLRKFFPDVPLIADAGLRLPSEAAALMEMGYDGILANTAIARAGDPVQMAEAFSEAVRAGRQGFLAHPAPFHEEATASTPMAYRAFQPPKQAKI